MANNAAKYTWILDSGIVDPNATLNPDELERWIDLAEAVVGELEPEGVDIRVRRAQDGDAAGLFRGHYPDTRGELDGGEDDDDDVTAREVTDQAFEAAWKRLEAEISEGDVIEVGDYVSAGTPYTEDYDEGVVLAISGDFALVGWQSGVETEICREDLRPGREGAWLGREESDHA